MPKIPTYDQLGQRVKDVSPQIGLRADPGMVNSQLAAADFYAKAQDVAYNFSMAEQAENTKAAKSEIKALYNDQSSELIRNSKKIDTAGAQSELDAFNKKFEKEYYNKGLNKSQVKEIKTEMSLYQSSKMQNHKTLSFDRGRDYNSTRYKNSSNALIAEITKLPVGTPLREAMEQELREIINTANENGETANLDYKTFDAASRVIDINDFTLMSGNANSLEEIKQLEGNLKSKKFMPSDNLNLNSLLQQNKTRVENEYADGIAKNIFTSNSEAFTDEKEFDKEIAKLKNSSLTEIVNEKGIRINLDPSKLPIRILENVKAKAEARRAQELSKEINTISTKLSVDVQGKSLDELNTMLENADKAGADRLNPEIKNYASRERIKQIISTEIKDKAKREIANSMVIIEDITSDLANDGVISPDNIIKKDQVYNSLMLAKEYKKANDFKLIMDSEIKASSAFQSIKFSSKTASDAKLLELKSNWDTSQKRSDELIYNSYAKQIKNRDDLIKKDFIDYYQKQNPEEKITISKMLSIQAEMGISALDRRVTTNNQLTDFEAKFNAPGNTYFEKATIGNEFISSFGAHQNKVLRHLINTGKITTVDNLLLAYPNDTRIKGAIIANSAENIKLNKDSTQGVSKDNRETVSTQMSTLFSDYSVSITGGGFDEVLSGGFTKGRANHIQNLRGIAINTANYYLREGIETDPSKAATRAYNEIVGNHNTFVQVNETPVRFSSEYEPVAQPLGEILETSIQYNSEYLKETIEAPPAPLGLDEAEQNQWKEKYYQDLSSRGTWRTTTDNSGVYMVDQLGNMVKRKDSAMEPDETGGMAPFITVKFDSLALTLDKYNEIQSGQGQIREKKRKLIDHFKNSGQLF
jgi:hypothetical protein